MIADETAALAGGVAILVILLIALGLSLGRAGRTFGAAARSITEMRNQAGASAAFKPAGPPAQWGPDPFGRHQQRFFDGATWTLHVSDNGVAGTDPVG